MQEYAKKKRYVFGTATSPVAIDTTTAIGGADGNVTLNRIDVYRVGVCVTTAYTPPASGALTMTLALADPVHASPATFATLSFGTTDYDIGDVIWADVIVPVAQTSGEDALGGASNPPASLIDVGPAGPLRVEPGQGWELTVANAAVAGDGVVVVEVVEHDEARPTGSYSGEVFINP